MKRVVIGLLTLLLILGISTSSALATDTNYVSADRYVSPENNDNNNDDELNQSDTQDNNDDQGISDVQEYDAEFEYDDFVYQFYNQEKDNVDGVLNLADKTNNDDHFNEQDQSVVDPKQTLLP